jgi:hypothetical protein
LVEKETYYEHWIVAFANILFRNKSSRPGSLPGKMDEVEARWSSDLAAEGAERARP